MINNPQLGYTLAFLIMGILFLCIAIFVLIINVESKLHRIFSFYSGAIALWAITTAIGINIETSEIAIWVFRTSSIGSILIPTACLHFTLTYTNQIEKYKYLLRSSYIISCFFLTIAYTPFFITSTVQRFSLKSVYIIGILYHPLVVHFLVATSISMYLCYRYCYFECDKGSISYRQSLYFFWTSILGYLGGIPTFLLVYNIEIPILHPFGLYLATLYGITIFYIIFRYQFLNIKFILKRTLVFSGLITSSILIFGITTYLLNYHIARLVGLSHNFITIISITMVALLADPLYRLLQKKQTEFSFKKSTNMNNRSKRFLKK
jgi:hypothetical protein